MANRRRERVRGVSRDRFVDTQDHSHHALHLIFLRGAAADDGLLDVARAVLVNRNVARERGADRGCACLTELERAVGVAAQEHPLDGDFGGAILAHELTDAQEDAAQPLAVLAARADAAPFDGRRAVADDVDDAEARDPRPRVYT